MQGSWRLAGKFDSSKEKQQRYVLPGEQYGKYVQMRFLNNRRGGNFVGIRFLQIKGLKKSVVI